MTSAASTDSRHYWTNVARRVERQKRKEITMWTTVLEVALEVDNATVVHRAHSMLLSLGA